MSKDFMSLEYKKERHKLLWHTNHKFRSVQTANNKVTLLLRKSNSSSYNYAMQCTKEELMTHLEKQFHSGMTWDNRGILWQCDHSIPLREAYDQGEQAFRDAQHYINIRPVLREKNCREKKGKRFPRASREVVQDPS